MPKIVSSNKKPSTPPIPFQLSSHWQAKAGVIIPSPGNGAEALKRQAEEGVQHTRLRARCVKARSSSEAARPSRHYHEAVARCAVVQVKRGR